MQAAAGKTASVFTRAASGASAGFSGRLAAVVSGRAPSSSSRWSWPSSLLARAPLLDAAAAAPPRRRSLGQARKAAASVAAAAAAGQAAAAAAAAATEQAAAAPSDAPSPPLSQLKAELRAAVAGLDRGIFGAPAARREQADLAARALEARNPTPDPLTERMDLVAGGWTLLYTTIAITGVRKTRLGLREFVKLGAFEQRIDPAAREAVNEIAFSVSGLGAALDGSLTVRATYEVVSGGRVAISFAGSSLAPSRLEAIFRANYDLLLSIFNPEGWLDVTYVDEDMRIGRDDKGHLFVLERAAAAAAEGSA